jgi:hypothetical protein
VTSALDLADTLKVGIKPVVPAPLIGAASKALLAESRDEQPAYRIVGLDTGLGAGDWGMTSEVILPSAYAATVELNLTPFISNVGTYLARQGIIPDNAWLKFGVDAALDFGNLLPFVGQAGAASKLGRVAGAASTLLGGGLKGRTGLELVDAATHAIETAGRVGNVAQDVMTLAKTGDKGAINALLGKALKGGQMAPEAAELAAKLKKNRKGLAAILENAEAIRTSGPLGPEMFLQTTRVGQLAAGQRTSRFAAIPPERAWRDPVAFARQAFLGITYEGERFLMPAANAVAGVMDKLAPLKGIPTLEKGLDVVARASDTVALREAAERLPGGINYFQRNMISTRAQLLVALPNEEQLAGLTDGLTEDSIRTLVQRATGKKAVSDEALRDATDGITAKIKDGKAQRDAVILQMRDLAVSTATTKRMEAWQAVGMIDSALAASDLADLRNWHASFVDDWIVQDPQGVGMALMGRAGAGDRIFAALAQADTEIIRNILPVKQDSQAVLDSMPYIVGHPDLFEIKDGRAFLTASMDTIRKESPLFADVLTLKGYDGYEKALRQTGLHPEITAILGDYRDVLSRTKDNLIHEGVLTGFLSDYFPRTGKFTKAGLEALGISGRSAHRFLDVAVERHAAGKADEVVDIVFGKPNAQGIRPLVTMLDSAGQGKLTLQETRRFSEGMLKRLVDKGWYEPGADGVAALTTYLSSAHKAMLVNKVWRDLPELPTRVMRSELEQIIGKAKAGLVSDAQLAELRRFYRSTFDIPAWARTLGIFDELTGNVRTFNTGSAMQAAAKRTYSRELAATQIKQARQRAEARALDTLTGAVEVAGVKTPPLEASWVKSGKAPSAEVGKAIRKAKQALFNEEAGRLAHDDFRTRFKKRGKKLKDTKPSILSFKGDSVKVMDAFDLWKRGDYSAGMELYDSLNAGIKSVVLLGDLFYFNALATISMVTDPRAMSRILTDDLGQLRRAPAASLPGAVGRALAAPVLGAQTSNAVVQAGVGAVAGLAAAPAFDADEPAQSAGFALAGAMWGAMLGTALRKGRDARKIAFNPMNVDSLFWAGQGGWRGRPDDRAIGVLSGFLRRQEEKLIRANNGATPKMAGILRSARHQVEDYEDTLFGTLHNGGVQAYFDVAFRPAVAKLRAAPGWDKLTDQEKFYKSKALATEVMAAANTAFSSQRYSLLFQNPHAERVLTRTFIAPQWATSRVLLASSMLANMGPVKSALIGSGIGGLIELVDAGFDPDEISRGPIFGAMGGMAGAWWSTNVVRRMGVQGDVYRNMALRLSGSALIGGWATYNLLNYAFTGHWMHENEEGRKLAVQLPNGQYFDPGKPFVEAYEWAGFLDKETFDAPVTGRLASKLAPIPQGMRLVFNRNYWGGAIIEADDGPTSIAMKLGEIAFQSTAPIGLRSTGEALYQGAFGSGFDGGDLNRSLAGIAGLPIKGKAGSVRAPVSDLMLSAALSRPPSLGGYEGLMR